MHKALQTHQAHVHNLLTSLTFIYSTADSQNHTGNKVVCKHSTQPEHKHVILETGIIINKRWSHWLYKGIIKWLIS